METDQILDLFDIPDSSALPTPSNSNFNSGGGGGAGREGREEDMVDATGEVKEKGKKGWLDDLGELWDESRYEEEFDLGGFLRRMEV